jgi:hypothetical protein
MWLRRGIAGTYSLEPSESKVASADDAYPCASSGGLMAGGVCGQKSGDGEAMTMIIPLNKMTRGGMPKNVQISWDNNLYGTVFI